MSEFDSLTLLLIQHSTRNQLYPASHAVPLLCTAQLCSPPKQHMMRFDRKLPETMMKNLSATKGAPIQQDMTRHAVAKTRAGAAHRRRP